MSRLGLVDVVGPSMVPTLRPGDIVLVRHAARVRPGDVVVARFADLPEQYVIKRADHPVADEWWVRSDNAAAGSDSRTHGPAAVEARALLVWTHRRPGRRRWLPRRIARAPEIATGTDLAP